MAMYIILLVILLIVTLTMIGSILLQRSEGGGLGIGGGNSTMGGLMTTRGTASFLTRMTAILAVGFMGICLGLAIFSGYNSKSKSILTVLTEQSAIERAEETAVQGKDVVSEIPAAPNSQ